MKPAFKLFHVFLFSAMLPPLVHAQDEHESPPASQPSENDTAKPGFSFFIWPEPAKLQGPIATDRPGYSDTASLVPRGHVQLETGYFNYTYDQEHHSETQNFTTPNTSLRIGLLDDFELRVKWGGYSTTETKEPSTTKAGRPITDHQHEDGATDMSVGFKSPILKHTDDNHLPNISIVPSMSLPTGTDNKTSGDVDPTFEAAWNYPVTDKLTIYGVGTVASISDSDGRFCQSSASAAVSYALTDKLSFFFEYFGIYPNSPHSDCQHNINGGPVILITDNIQLDFGIGMGLNEESPDFFTNVGISIRF